MTLKAKLVKSQIWKEKKQSKWFQWQTVSEMIGRKGSLREQILKKSIPRRKTSRVERTFQESVWKQSKSHWSIYQKIINHQLGIKLRRFKLREFDPDTEKFKQKRRRSPGNIYWSIENKNVDNHISPVIQRCL